MLQVNVLRLRDIQLNRFNLLKAQQNSFLRHGVGIFGNMFITQVWLLQRNMHAFKEQRFKEITVSVLIFLKLEIWFC